MTLRRLDYTILFVRDLERSLAFYRDVVGLPLKLQDDGYAEFALENTKLALFERSRVPELLGEREAWGPEAPEATREPAGEVCFVVADADAEAERVRSRGAHILAGPVDRPWGQRTVHVADPDGFLVEFAQELERQA